jgi:riboflavin kinase, archaea type
MKAEVMPGMGKGAKYIEAYMQKIAKEIGFKPYPGTLNLKVASIPPFEYDDMIHIPAFEGYGKVNIVPCAVNYERAFAVFPDKTKHEKGIVEVIAEKNLKEKLGLKEGSFVDLQF